MIRGYFNTAAFPRYVFIAANVFAFFRHSQRGNSSYLPWVRLELIRAPSDAKARALQRLQRP